MCHKIPCNIQYLAKRDVERHGLPDGSVLRENKSREVLEFLERAWAKIDAMDTPFKDKVDQMIEIQKRIYPNDHDGDPDLKQNSALHRLFVERGLC